MQYQYISTTDGEQQLCKCGTCVYFLTLHLCFYHFVPSCSCKTANVYWGNWNTVHCIYIWSTHYICCVILLQFCGMLACHNFWHWAVYHIEKVAAYEWKFKYEIDRTEMEYIKMKLFGNNWEANTIYLQSGHIVVWYIWTRSVVMQFTYGPKVFNASQANQIKW